MAAHLSTPKQQQQPKQLNKQRTSRSFHGNEVINNYNSPLPVDEEANLKHSNFGMSREEQRIQQIILNGV
jgi:hypothetical protein